MLRTFFLIMILVFSLLLGACGNAQQPPPPVESEKPFVPICQSQSSQRLTCLTSFKTFSDPSARSNIFSYPQEYVPAAASSFMEQICSRALSLLLKSYAPPSCFMHSKNSNFRQPVTFC